MDIMTVEDIIVGVLWHLRKRLRGKRIVGDVSSWCNAFHGLSGSEIGIWLGYRGDGSSADVEQALVNLLVSGLLERVGMDCIISQRLGVYYKLFAKKVLRYRGISDSKLIGWGRMVFPLLIR